MQLQKLNRAFLSLPLILFSFAGAIRPAMADTLQGGFVGSLSSTPTQFSTTVGKVNTFKVRVIPGVCSKVYVGFSNMNVSTLAGVIKVLYPNCNGGLSDEWDSPPDVTGTDSFDTSQIYLAADQSGTEILWESNSTGVTATSMLVPFGTQGPMPADTAYGGSGQFLEAWIVPGMEGKETVVLMPQHGDLKVCYPNNGTVTGNITDGWTHGAATRNGISQYLWNEAQISGEYMLVTQWQYS